MMSNALKKRLAHFWKPKAAILHMKHDLYLHVHLFKLDGLLPVAIHHNQNIYFKCSMETQNEIKRKRSAI